MKEKNVNMAFTQACVTCNHLILFRVPPAFE